MGKVPSHFRDTIRVATTDLLPFSSLTARDFQGKRLFDAQESKEAAVLTRLFVVTDCIGLLLATTSPIETETFWLRFLSLLVAFGYFPASRLIAHWRLRVEAEPR